MSKGIVWLVAVLLVLATGCGANKVITHYGPDGKVTSVEKELTDYGIMADSERAIRETRAKNPPVSKLKIKPEDPDKPLIVQNASIQADIYHAEADRYTPLPMPINAFVETVRELKDLTKFAAPYAALGWITTSTSADRREENLAAQARPTNYTSVGGDYYTGDRSGPTGGNRYDGTGNGDHRDNPDNSDRSNTENPPGGGE
ncbi:MAG: hypothetical protein KQJ78_18360 [Deltaproteobacteria bacterium]|nr:hypothetical protein [Deltaproteobacteria bacterium]